ncbi:MAG: flagellar filament capping protein FliD [Pirellulales bacterium]|nr:flagellar filament capping protein FliD [Pirellulales bacterium]
MAGILSSGSGTISSALGLITGMDIGGTVEKLIALQAKPRDLLKARNDTLTKIQTAYTELATYLQSLKSVFGGLGQNALYKATGISSSNTGLLAAVVTGTPAVGSYQFTPLRPAQAQQFISDGLQSATDPLGGGTISFRFGDHLERSAGLDSIGGGRGFQPGKIRITDRGGNQATIDLSAAQNIDDVLDAINNNVDINVAAQAIGGRLRLVDLTGQSASNLMVQEVGQGTTAASLGLSNVNIAANAAEGEDIFYLSRNLDLNALNDGLGIRIHNSLADIKYTLRDGTTGEIDLSPLTTDPATGIAKTIPEKTLGGVLDKINAAAPGKMAVEISADGESLVLTDLTTGGFDFQFQSENDSRAVEGLGLARNPAGGTIVGGKILAGAKTVLLSSLNGGRGFGALGAVSLTNRAGLTADVDLSQAQTLEDVLDALNASGLNIAASVNRAKNGILLTDNSGGTGNLLVANGGDGIGTADKLKIAGNTAAASLVGGDLRLQTVGYNTLLAELNGGAGVVLGSIRITDSLGGNDKIDLAKTINGKKISTVGELLQAVNAALLHAKVHADINDTGDGIVIRDLADGGGEIKVEDAGSTTAKDLNLLGKPKFVVIGGQNAQVVDGSLTRTVTLKNTDTLENLRDQINALGAGVTASILNDGSNRPYRLAIAGNSTGASGRFLLDTSIAPLVFAENAQAQDALLFLGSSGAASRVLASSRTNTFDQVLPGAALTIQGVSGAAVNVTVSSDTSSIVTQMQSLVSAFNQFQKKLSEDMAYDETTNTASVLTGDTAALQLGSRMYELLTSEFDDAGSIHSLFALGFTVKADGTLALDAARLETRLAADLEGVKQFFTTKTAGASDKFKSLLDSLSGEGNSLLALNINGLDKTIRENKAQIEAMQARLDQDRDLLLIKFYNMELAVSKLQSNLNALSSIDWITDYNNGGNGLFSNGN